MKVSKVFGCVLGLHVGVIAVLLQPGCRTNQPPTQTYTQTSTQGSKQAYTQEHTIKSSVKGASRQKSTALIQATRAEPSGNLDSAYSASFSGGENTSVDMGNDDFSEFNDFAPIEPIAPIPSSDNTVTRGSQTVNIAGSSLETYTVKKGDNLWSIAKRYNISLDELYASSGLNKNSVLRIGQQIQIPVEGGTATVNTVSADTYQPSSFNQGSTEYTVKPGDSLSKIANQFGTSVRAIKAANGKTTDLIRVGEKLIVPVSGNSSNTGASNAAASTPSVTYTVPTSSSTNSINSTTGARTHTVRSGEYPATIARKYGMTTGELLALNGITDPRKLQVGKVLQVSGSGSAANVDSRTETVAAPATARVTSSTLIPATVATPTPQPSVSTRTSTGPVEITVIEADPLIEGEVTEIEADESFDGAVEIPVIRLEQ